MATGGTTHLSMPAHQPPHSDDTCINALPHLSFAPHAVLYHLFLLPHCHHSLTALPHYLHTQPAFPGLHLVGGWTAFSHCLYLISFSQVVVLPLPDAWCLRTPHCLFAGRKGRTRLPHRSLPLLNNTHLCSFGRTLPRVSSSLPLLPLLPHLSLSGHQRLRFGTYLRRFLPTTSYTAHDSFALPYIHTRHAYTHRTPSPLLLLRTSFLPLVHAGSAPAGLHACSSPPSPAGLHCAPRAYLLYRCAAPLALTFSLLEVMNGGEGDLVPRYPPVVVLVVLDEHLSPGPLLPQVRLCLPLPYVGHTQWA